MKTAVIFILCTTCSLLLYQWAQRKPASPSSFFFFVLRKRWVLAVNFFISLNTTYSSSLSQIIDLPIDRSAVSSMHCCISAASGPGRGRTALSPFGLNNRSVLKGPSFLSQLFLGCDQCLCRKGCKYPTEHNYKSLEPVHQKIPDSITVQLQHCGRIQNDLLDI